MKVEILGVGCAKCNKLFDLVSDLVTKNGIDADVVKVEDIKIRNYLLAIPINTEPLSYFRWKRLRNYFCSSSVVFIP